MRGFFILLLLTNIVFIAWQFLAKKDEQENIDIYHGIGMAKEGLTLLSELSPEQQPALRDGLDDTDPSQTLPMEVTTEPGEADASSVPDDEGAVELAAPKANGAVCLRIANIDGRASLDQILRLLRANKASAIEQGETQFKRINYWVMLPPYPSRAKADEAAAILTAKRVKDFFIVRSGEYENAVSLGVFSTEERAKRRYDQIVQMKARLRNPRIEAMELPAKRYTVSYTIASEQAREALDILLGGIKAPVSEEIRCK